MDKVWMSHPRIDDGKRKIEVSRSALRHYQRAGWAETDPPPPPTPRRQARGKQAEQTTEAPATAGASALPETKSPRARRATRGDE